MLKLKFDRESRIEFLAYHFVIARNILKEIDSRSTTSLVINRFNRENCEILNIKWKR
jgi:hypothetical protein